MCSLRLPYDTCLEALGEQLPCILTAVLSPKILISRAQPPLSQTKVIQWAQEICFGGQGMTL